MPTCPNCQGYVPLGQNVCPKCSFEADFEEIARAEHARRDSIFAVGEAETARREAEQKKDLARVQITMLDSILGCKLDADLGIMGADIVEYGSGWDLPVTVAGRLGEMREKVVQKLRENALAIGADAVVAVSFSFGTVETSGLWLVLSATGTAVTLALDGTAGS